MRGISKKRYLTMAFLGWFVHYVLIFVVLVVVAGLGIFAGKKLSDRKDAKNAGETGNIEETK